MFKIDLAKNTSNIEETKAQDTNIKETEKIEHKDVYDILVVGAGGSGYTAGIYSARYNLKTFMIAEEFGGQMNINYHVENYPGFRSIVAHELMDKFKEHAIDLGVELVLDEVISIEKSENKFKIMTKSHIYYAYSVILALGTKRRKLNVKGEDNFVAKGVSYCATCDGAFYKDKVVAVIGGGDSAFASALILEQYAKKIYIIHRRDEFRAKPSMIDKLKNNPKIEFVMNTNVLEITGNNKVEKIKTDNPKNQEMLVEGIFIDVGVIPTTSLAKKIGIELDEADFIKVNEKQETNLEGIYASGDITTESNRLKQLIVACAEGAIAAESAFNYVKEKKQDVFEKLDEKSKWEHHQATDE
jgi:thioredoxin reductase (NADPH)